MISRRLFTLGGLGLAAAAVSGCEVRPKSRNFPEITFKHLTPYQMLVREIEIEEAFRSSGQAPNVEYLFPVPPARAAKRWAQDRLQAVGTEGYLRYIIHDASVTETKLERESGVTGVFTVDQSERYDGTLVVEMQIHNARGYTEASVKARAERGVSVPEDISLGEREQVWFQLTEDLMAEINRQLEQAIAKHMGRFVL